jgi:hypothetical protein
MLQFLEPTMILLMKDISSELRINAYTKVQSLLDDQSYLMYVYREQFTPHVTLEPRSYDLVHKISHIILNSPSERQVSVYLEFPNMCDEELVYLQCTSEELVSYILKQVPFTLSNQDLIDWMEVYPTDSNVKQRYQRYLKR